MASSARDLSERRWPKVAAGAGVVVLVAAGATVVGARLLPRGPSDEALVASVTDEFLEAWSQRDWDRLSEQVVDDSAERATATHRQLQHSLDLTEVAFTPAGPEVGDDTATVPVEAQWEIAGLGTHSYETTLELTRVDAEEPTAPNDHWRLDWSASAVHPQLTPTGRGERVRVPSGRAPILGAAGTILATTREEVVVAAVPDQAVAGELLSETVAATTDADPAAIAGVLEQGGQEPRPLARLSRPAFEEIRDQLLAVPGVRFLAEPERIRQGPEVLTQLVGTVGEVTAEQLEELPDHYRAGDTAGRSGLEQAHETRLAGAPGEQARLVDAGGVAAVLAERAPEEPRPLQTTLDPGMAAAAEAALSGVAEPAAMVAVDVPSGELRAAVSTPVGGLARALRGRYPPGSTFKTVTAAALLGSGLRPNTVVDCPPTVTIHGRSFRNAGREGPGAISFDEAFRRSCNTAFTQLAVNLGSQALTETAETLGFNATLELGLPVADPSFPEPADDAELAAAAIGQARVETTPAHLASVAAAVAAGEWRPPVIVRGADSGPARPLPGAAASTLRQMMRGVVESGTGTAAQRPGEPVAGKTGSAEFGDGPPFDTHAWFHGFRGDVAFSVFVEGGGGGGSTAAPVAAAFLAQLESATSP